MAAFTTHGGTLILAWMLTTGTATRPTAWYVALHDGDPGATGASNEITTSEDADYVRKSVTFDTPSAKQTANSGSVSWTINSGSAGFTITHVSIWDASTSGNCLLAVAKAVSTAVVASDVITFDIGEIVANAL